MMTAKKHLKKQHLIKNHLLFNQEPCYSKNDIPMQKGEYRPQQAKKLIYVELFLFDAYFKKNFD